MLYALGGSVVFGFLALWSLAAWAFHTITAWTASNAGGLSVAVWVVWGIGSILLIVLGFVVTGLIAPLHRRASMLAAPAGGAAAAG